MDVERMVMFTFVSNNEHSSIIQSPFDVLSCRATSKTATLIITPELKKKKKQKKKDT